MMSFRFCFAFIFMMYVMTSAIAQISNPIVNSNNLPNVITSAINALIRVSVPKKLSKKDMITGECNYIKTGSCNGATISLKLKNQIVYTLTMTSMWEFKIPHLKPKEQYVLTVEWKKFGLKKEVNVIPGEYVTIQLE